MVRANKKIQQSVNIPPKRKTHGRTSIPLKALKTNKNPQKIIKSQQYAQKVNKKQNQQGTTSSSVTPRTSRRLAMQRQKTNCPVIPACLSVGSNMHAKPATLNDMIVIEDTDDEKETNDLNSQLNQSACFYEDRSPGMRDLEVPLYEIEPKTTKPDDEICDASVIVLDSTIENLQENVSAITNNVQPQYLPKENLSQNSNILLIGDTVRISSQEKLQVIDLSDDSDDPSCTPSNVPAQSIPVGYSIAKPRLKTKNSSKKQPPNRSKRTVKTLASPPLLPSSLSSTPTSCNNATNENQKRRMIIIDGNNVAYSHLNGKMFSVKGLNLCIQYFKKLGHEVVAVVPQFKLKRAQSTDQELLQKLHRQGDVILAPSKNLPGQYSSPYDDRLILSIAEKFDGVIVSNDNYRDLLDTNSAWRKIIETRVVGYTWVKDCFFLPDDPYGRQGPSLYAILHGYSP